MSYPDFTAAGAEVMGVSPDSRDTLDRYARDKETPFGFVSDEARRIAESFGATKGNRQPRVTVIVQRGGTVAATMHHEVLIPKHISAALDKVRSLTR